MVITHNIMAANAAMNLNNNNNKLQKNLEKLSSGYKINRAADDAAGLAISEQMRSKINGLDQSVKNATDAIGLIQTCDGALSEIQSMIHRMEKLALMDANGTIPSNYNEIKMTKSEDPKVDAVFYLETKGSPSESAINDEIYELTEEISRIANDTSYNGIKLLATPGVEGQTDSVIVQIGPSANETLSINGKDMTLGGIFNSLDVYHGFDVTDPRYTRYAIFKEPLEYDHLSDSQKSQYKNRYNELVTNYLHSHGIDASLGQNENVYGFTGSATNGQTWDTLDSMSSYIQNKYGIEESYKFQYSVYGFAALAYDELDGVVSSCNLFLNGFSGTDIEKYAKIYTQNLRTENIKSNGHLYTSVIPSLDINHYNFPIQIEDYSNPYMGSYMGKTFIQYEQYAKDVPRQVVGNLNRAVDYISSYRAELGAKQNRLEHVLNNLNTTSENVISAESRIRDTDMATEIASYSKNNVISQASMAMLAQANQSAQSVLQLLQ